MNPDTCPTPAPPATIPMALPADLRATLDAVAVGQGDAVILRVTSGALDVLDRLEADARRNLPGVPLLVVDGSLVGVHLVRAATTRRNPS